MSLILLLACTKSIGETGSPDDSAAPDPLWAYRDCRSTEVRTVDGVVTGRAEYDYDALGQLIEKREDLDGDGIFNAVFQWFYEDGLLVAAGLDGDLDGALDFRVHYGYDADGNKILKEVDLYDDGVIEGIDSWVYQGGLLREERLDTDYQTEADTFGAWTYDSSDRPSGLVWTGRSPRSTEAWAYDGSWTEHEISDHGSGTLLARDGARIEDALLVETWNDTDADGVVDLRATFAYDNERLSGATGTGFTGDEVAWTSVSAWSYDGAGRLVEVATTRTQGGSDTVEVKSTTWICAD